MSNEYVGDVYVLGVGPTTCPVCGDILELEHRDSYSWPIGKIEIPWEKKDAIWPGQGEPCLANLNVHGKSTLVRVTLRFEDGCPKCKWKLPRDVLIEYTNEGNALYRQIEKEQCELHDLWLEEEIAEYLAGLEARVVKKHQRQLVAHRAKGRADLKQELKQMKEAMDV